LTKHGGKALVSGEELITAAYTYNTQSSEKEESERKERRKTTIRNGAR